MRKLIKNLLCLLAFAITLLFASGCDLDDVVVDIIVPGYGGGSVIDVYPDYDDDCYCDDGGFFFDFYADF